MSDHHADYAALERDIFEEIRYEVSVGWEYGEACVDGCEDAAASVMKLLVRRGLVPTHIDGLGRTDG